MVILTNAAAFDECRLRAALSKGSPRQFFLKSWARSTDPKLTKKENKHERPKQSIGSAGRS